MSYYKAKNKSSFERNSNGDLFFYTEFAGAGLRK